MSKNQETETNFVHEIFIRKTFTILFITGVIIFLSKIHLSFLCVFFIPIIYVLTISKPYKNINNSETISLSVDSLCQEQSGKNEYGFYLTQFLNLIWPHIFLQERVNMFRDNLQWVIDRNPISGIESIHLTSLKLGDLAPQIVSVSLPNKPLPAENSFLIQCSIAYCPAFELAAILKVKPTLPDFNVTFTDISIQIDVLIQMEFTPDCTIPQMPFWTAMDFSLAKMPEITGFNFQLFSASISKESLKNYLSTMATKALWSFFGIPKGFLWDRVKGKWPLARVYGTNSMLRSSASLSYMKKYGQIKDEAAKLCKKLHIPEPLTIKTIELKSEETTTHYLEVLNTVRKHRDFSTIASACDEFINEKPSVSELIFFFNMVHTYVINETMRWTKDVIMLEKKKKEGLTQERNDRLSQIYKYINFLSTQRKVNWETFDKLKLEEKVNSLEDILQKFQKKLFKG